MSITPNEILEKDFSRRFRGYDPREVKAFLEEVANFLAFIIKERNELRDKILAYKKQIAILKQQEAEFRRSLTAAHKAIEDMKESAQKEADLIVERAKLDADRIVADAHKEAISLEDRIRKLRMLQRETVHKIRSSFEGFLRMLDDDSLLPPVEMEETLELTAKEIRAIQEDITNDESGDNESDVQKDQDIESSSKEESNNDEKRENQKEGFAFEPEKLWPEEAGKA